MANKQNMYVGLNREAEKTLNEIKDSIILYSPHEDGFLEILGYDISKQKKIEIMWQIAKVKFRLH